LVPDPFRAASDALVLGRDLRSSAAAVIRHGRINQQRKGDDGM
jgi:hypothetical protein